MKRVYKIISLSILFLLLLGLKGYSQQDTMYVCHRGYIIYERSIDNIDSIKFTVTGEGYYTRIINIYVSGVLIFDRAISEIDSIVFDKPTLLNLLATITTKTVSDITDNSATLGGNITFAGFPEYTERGVCYSTSRNPTTNDIKLTVAGNGAGEYTINATDLIPNTTYYVRAYAINDAGVAYGNEVSFKTFDAPFTYYGDVILSTEAEVIALKNAEHRYVRGNVTVRGSALQTLTLLENQLKEISGNLILEASNLSTLDGLYGLEKIGKDFIVRNGKMVSFEGLNNLTHIAALTPYLPVNQLRNFF